MSKGKAKDFVKEVKEETAENEETSKEEFFKEKKDKKSVFERVINVVLWVVLFAWMGICLTDFFISKSEKAPVFCIKKDVIKYDDGNVDSCLGLGYKIYNYKRTSCKGIEYGPFWTADRSATGCTK